MLDDLVAVPAAAARPSAQLGRCLPHGRIEDRPARGDQVARPVEVRLAHRPLLDLRVHLGHAEVRRRPTSLALDHLELGGRLLRKTDPSGLRHHRIALGITLERLEGASLVPARPAPARPVQSARERPLGP